ncbi:MAG: NAD-dependent epimerase/dehydratase family protein [Chloroflexi bacterium]|nr:NAD-dependent epimerase/dehydratase family protein [Chloroflexota bacterium]
MRVLVTGATGFVGANLVAELTARGYTVRILRRATSRLDALEGLPYEEVVGDILDEDSLRRAMQDCTWVFHAAGAADYWRSQPDRIYRVNVTGTRCVMAAALATQVQRVVHTSSVAALGAPPDGRIGDESMSFNLRPEEFRYGHSKYLAEQEVLAAVKRGLPAVIVNPTVILGPRDVHLISGSLIREVYRRWIPFALPGGLNLVDVAAVAAGHIAAAERGRVGERYILGGVNLTHMELLRMTAQVVGQRPPIGVLPRACVPALAAVFEWAQRIWPRPLPISAEQVRLSTRYFFFSSRKAEAELGLPPTDPVKVIRETFLWYRDHGYL